VQEDSPLDKVSQDKNQKKIREEKTKTLTKTYKRDFSFNSRYIVFTNEGDTYR